VSGALDAIRVVELAGHWAGAGVGRILADLGADVTKIAAPRRIWSPAEAALDRGKRLERLDLGDPSGRGAAAAFVEAADLVIENGRPGRLERFGFGAEACRSRRPELIWLSLPGFPASDPRRTLRATEGVVCAAAGLYAERGLSHALRGSPPAITPMPMASAYATAFGIVGALAALYARARDGRGESIEVSLYNALLEGLSYNHLILDDPPERYLDRRLRRLRRGEPLPAEPEIQRLMDPVYRSYRTADGAWIYLAMPPHRRILRETLRALGLWEALLGAGLPTDDPYMDSELWRSPAEGSVFGPPKLAERWFQTLYDRLQETVARRSSADWELRLRRARVAAQRVQTAMEWVADEHALASGLIEVDTVSATRRPGPSVWRIDRQAPDAPRASRDPPHASTPPRAALAGVRILDLANVIAGPTIAGVLARFGADVVKVDNVEPAFDPAITVLLALQYGRGKRSLLLDLKHPDGRSVFERLARAADLVTYNGASDQPARLGVDLDTLQALNPRASLAQVSAFGGPRPGPDSDRLGFDEVLQAATGIMADHAPAGAPPEEFAQFGTVDVITGVLGAAAALVGLLVAERTGRGAWMATSLAAGAQLIQGPRLFVGPDGAGGSGVTGELVACADGWLFLDATEVEKQALSARLGTSPAAASADAFAAVRVCDVQIAAEGLDIAAHPVANFAEIRRRHTANVEAPWSGEARFDEYDDHPIGRRLSLLAPCAIHLSERPVIWPAPPPKYGQHTVETLGEAGLDPASLDALIRSGAAATAWPHHRRYLPE
jgi:crotonobetainyl-CoA:carnitine CoA-transferase CaiB-like acyl-CoA transferase